MCTSPLRSCTSSTRFESNAVLPAWQGIAKESIQNEQRIPETLSDCMPCAKSQAGCALWQSPNRLPSQSVIATANPIVLAYVPSTSLHPSVSRSSASTSTEGAAAAASILEY